MAEAKETNIFDKNDIEEQTQFNVVIQRSKELNSYTINCNFVKIDIYIFIICVLDESIPSDEYNINFNEKKYFIKNII